MKIVKHSLHSQWDHLGFYQCECMPFGLTNTPDTFQRLMESCLGDMDLKWVIIYLDDIIIFLKTPRDTY